MRCLNCTKEFLYAGVYEKECTCKRKSILYKKSSICVLLLLIMKLLPRRESCFVRSAVWHMPTSLSMFLYVAENYT